AKIDYLVDTIFLCSSPDRRPTDFGPRSLPDATAPKGSEDKGHNVRNQGIPTQCPASAWMDSFDNIFRCKDQQFLAMK
ncbi:hypothetical protein THAOC_24586, partial [Thalassiosira oceanica]